ncbi:MAG: hypothetical protein H6717_14130 [Polyangiaceae bacterium]|nr:hypothetical protein [Polyangiaceae bacterium]
MDLDAPFDLTESTIPPPVVERAERRLERFALEVLTLTETAVVSVVDVIGDEARSTIVGHAPLPDGEEEVLLELWLQEVCVTSLRRVPSLLRALLPASTASVVPVTTPSGFSLSVAMTPPCTSPRALARVQALALDLVLELEADERARQRRAVPARRRRARSGIRRAA